MCRNIKPLFNYEPPATDEEIRDAAMQYVRKISGFSKPSRANNDAFQVAIEAVAVATAELIASLETTAPPKNRAEEAVKAQERALKRFSI